MIYYIFAAAFAFGAIASLIYIKLFYITVDAKVLESRDLIVRKDREFNRITVQHAVAYKVKDEETVKIVDCIPVREPDGAVVKLKLYRTTLEPAADKQENLLAAFAILAMAALGCLALGCMNSGLFPNPDNLKLTNLGVLSFVYGIFFTGVLLYDVLILLNPRVICVKGKYEGMMHLSANHRLTTFYSLWYGEYKQYARYRGFIPVSSKAQTILFYNTKTGVATKKADIVCNVCLAAIVVAALVCYGLFIL